MTKQQKKAGTKERLLRAACGGFTSRGYSATTVQDICAEAEANIAAVNYHFGSKLNLYRAVWQRAVEENEIAYPIPSGFGQRPLAWLKTLMTQRLRAVLDHGPAGWLPDLIRRELMAPSPLHDEVVRERISGNLNQAHSAVRAYLGQRATEDEVHRCSAMVASSFVMFNLGKTMLERYGGGKQRLSPAEVDLAIDFTLSYHLGGLQRVRRNMAERGRT